MINKKSILNRQLINSRSRSLLGPNFTIQGRALTNASGDIDLGGAGFQYLIETLSYIREKVINQKFYQVSIADYLPMDVGEAAWSEEIVQNLTFSLGGDFFTGDMNQHQGNGTLAAVEAALSPIRMPTKTWAKAANWTIIEIAKAAAASKWDIVEGKLGALKKNWDLGIQEVAFLGHPDDALMTGLLTNTGVTINTTLITEAISGMTETELTAFLSLILAAYFANTNSTSLPDTLVIPTSDYLGLLTPYSSTYPNISKLTYMLDAFRAATSQNANEFQILPLAYAQAANSKGKLSVDRYTLYKREPETLSMSIPVDLTMLEADTSNKFNWQQPAYGQYSGVLANRPAEIFYMDLTAP